MRYCTLFLFIILTQASKAQVMLPAYQGVQYKGGLSLPVVIILCRYHIIR